MKKLLLSVLLSTTLLSVQASELGLDMIPSASTLSVLSVGSIVLSPVILPISILHSLSSTVANTTVDYNQKYKKQPTMTVEQVSYNTNGTAQVYTRLVGLEHDKIDFEVPAAAIKNTQIMAGTEIKVQQNAVGYTINANDKVVGIVPVENKGNYFKQQKL